jgi:multidrug efflux pump subunit AcrA (membrane-fusion protein)
MKNQTSPLIRRSVPAVLALAAGILVALASAGCGTQAATPAGGPPAAEVSIAPVISRNVREWDDFTGRISAVESVELRPRVSGYIDRVAYEEGQEVRRRRKPTWSAPAAKPSSRKPRTPARRP